MFPHVKLMFLALGHKFDVEKHKFQAVGQQNQGRKKTFVRQTGNKSFSEREEKEIRENESPEKSFLQSLVGLAVFAFVLVVEHGEVGLITAGGDEMVFESLKNGTTRLMGVGAIGETTVL